jgi:hypothetical protein
MNRSLDSLLLLNQAFHVQAAVLEKMQHFTLLCLHSFADGKVEPGLDGRYSAGPLDVSAFLASPAIAGSVDALVARRQQRNLAKGVPAGAKSTHLPYVVHVSLVCELSYKWSPI